MFLDSGVYRSDDGRKLAGIIKLLGRGDGMILNDVDETLGWTGRTAPGGMLSVTSPFQYVYHAFKSASIGKGEMFYMKQWDWTEIALAR